MKVKILLFATGNIEDIKISSVLWGGLHNHKARHFYNNNYDKFLIRYNLNPTIFNLNCLDELRGVILTDAQILKLRMRCKGEIIKNDTRNKF